MSFKEFLKNKPLFYNKIDYDRMPNVWQKIKTHFKIPKIIQIVGTNAKGTTGRFLAYMLYLNGLNVGHYSSPHLLMFNERIWRNGDVVVDAELEKAHKYLQLILDKEDIRSLSYFEYTTIMAMFIYQECDYVILEAGMGGEYDATTIFGNDLSLLTPVDYDHQEFLGNSIKDIATTKLKSVKNIVILAKQHHKEVCKVANELSKEKSFLVYDVEDFLNDKIKKMVKEYREKNSLPLFLEQNILLAASACKCLGYNLKFPKYSDLKLVGRCQQIAKNITIDVGHNTLAAKAIRGHFSNKQVVLIYNSYKDKDYKEILSILKPIVKRVEILKISDARIEDEKELKKIIDKLGFECSEFFTIDANEEYLVFGSFSVVEKFLKDFFER